MCPMLLSSLRDGPAMVLSPPQEHAFLQFPCPPKRDVAAGATSRPFSTHGVPPNAFSSGVNTSFSGALTPSPFTGGKPSRKRSRDDVAAEDSLSNGVATTPAPVPRKEPIYGDGMVFSNARTGMALSAASQTGTWYDEAAGNAIAASRASQRHASESSRKSQRLDPSGPGLDDLALSRMERQLQQIDKDDHCRPVNAASRCSPLAPAQPLVDDATRLLGISWQRIQTDDTDLAAAIRGWKKYIDRQFSRYLVDCEILMKNRALNAYLVTARPMTAMGPANLNAFYLFSDDLTQSQLVGSSWEACLRNLQSTPILFEGTEILNASDKLLNPDSRQHRTFLANPAETGLPLIQTLCAQPASAEFGQGLNNSVGMGTVMDLDA